ncbi:MAG: gfo/Idh/MocA family oxidoreductase [Zetaproteobacteria bacterium]|nr:MAG: gfo/Idh/MocA family oxidoreductase [Zetaproteobacteria bacterium]
MPRDPQGTAAARLRAGDRPGRRITALLLLDGSALPRGAVTPPPPLALGLIGPGAWGAHYIRTISTMAGIRLTRIAGRRPERLRPYADQGYNIAHHWRELIEADDLDGVIVATPTSTHADIVRAAIRRRLPVIVEKPLTLDPGEAAELLEEARAHHATVLVDHIHLHNPAWHALKEALAADAAPIHHITAIAGRRGPFRRDTPVLWDWGVHDAAMLLDLLGRPPERVDCRITPDPPGELVELLLTFPEGISASVTVGNNLQRRMRRFTVHTDRQSLCFDDTLPQKLWRLPPASEQAGAQAPPTGGRALPHPRQAPLIRLLDHFAARIRAGQSDWSDLQLARAVTGLLHRCQLQAVDARNGAMPPSPALFDRRQAKRPWTDVLRSDRK